MSDIHWSTSLSRKEIYTLVANAVGYELVQRNEDGDDGLAGISVLRPNPPAPPSLQAFRVQEWEDDGGPVRPTTPPYDDI